MIGRLLGGAQPSDRHELVVDRIACAGRGVCAQILPGIELDDWGYPIIHDAVPDPDDAHAAVVMCPSRALRWVERTR